MNEFNCALVYKCGKCDKFVVVKWDRHAWDSLLCSCGGNMEHIASIDSVIVLENMLNGEKFDYP